MLNRPPGERVHPGGGSSWSQVPGTSAEGAPRQRPLAQRKNGMVEHNTTNSLPASEPVPNRRTRSLRTRETHSTQDDVPHHATDRREPNRMAVALEHARLCARIADDNRGKDILLLDLRKATPLVDYFVIVTAASRRQSNAIASEIDQEMKKRGEAKLGHRRVRGRPLDPDRLRRLRRPHLLARGPGLLRPRRHLGRCPAARLAGARPPSRPGRPTTGMSPVR